MGKINLKTPEEIALIREGGQRLKNILSRTVKATRVSMRLSEVEALAWQAIEKAQGKPAFAQVPGYRWATCININEGVVHGIPDDYQIQDGDIVSLDMGILYKGWNTDVSTTFQVGSLDKKKADTGKYKPVSLKNGEIVKPSEIRSFLNAGKRALKVAIASAKPGKRIGHISAAIQDVIEEAGYTCLRNLTGHGIGRELHEWPPIPCFVNGNINATPMIKPGMVLAIEAIYAMGSYETETDKDDKWTIYMKDGKIAAVFEKTIAILDDGPFICT